MSGKSVEKKRTFSRLLKEEKIFRTGNFIVAGFSYGDVIKKMKDS